MVTAKIDEVLGEYQISIFDEQWDFSFIWADELKYNPKMPDEILLYRHGHYTGKVAVKWLTNN